MTVYVDDMAATFGRMTMCHMIADSDTELHAMADRIGVARRWHQKPGTPRSHYDIALSKRALAIEAGAVIITQRQCAAMTARRRVEGALGNPAEAVQWLGDHTIRRMNDAPASGVPGDATEERNGE